MREGRFRAAHRIAAWMVGAVPTNSLVDPSGKLSPPEFWCQRLEQAVRKVLEMRPLVRVHFAFP